MKRLLIVFLRLIAALLVMLLTVGFSLIGVVAGIIWNGLSTGFMLGPKLADRIMNGD